MLPADIKDLLNPDTVEWERLELKEGFDRDDIVKAICAFANDTNNHGGGYLVLGCREEGGKPVLPPTGLDPRKMDTYQQDMRPICNQLEPYYSPVIRPYVYDGQHVLVLWIPTGDQRPYKAPESQATRSLKTYFIRQGSSTVKANSIERDRLLEQAAKVKFESRINPDVLLSAINPVLIRNYLRESGSILAEDAHEMSLEQLCKTVMVAKDRGDGLRPLNVGLLLFSDKPDEYFPGAMVHVVIFNDDQGTDPREEIFYVGPVNKQAIDTLQFFKDKIIKEKPIGRKGQQQTIFNYPYWAIREAVVNAVYHRSYEIDNTIEIAVYPSRIQIVSFSGPLPPVTEFTLSQDRQDVRDYRNPILGTFLKDIKLAEKLATGLKRIKKELMINGSLPPAFDIGEQRTHFAVTFYQHPDWEDDTYSFDNPPLDDIIAGVNVSPAEYIILEKGMDGSTLDEIQKAMIPEFSDEQIIVSIQRLIHEGLLSEKIVKKMMGFITIKLYRTTAKGQKVYQQSF